MCPSMIGVEVLESTRGKGKAGRKDQRSALPLLPSDSSSPISCDLRRDSRPPIQEPQSSLVGILRSLLERSLYSREPSSEAQSHDDGSQGQECSCYDEDFGSGVLVTRCEAVGKKRGRFGHGWEGENVRVGEEKEEVMGPRGLIRCQDG